MKQALAGTRWRAFLSILLLFFFYAFLVFDSRIPCSLSSCPKTLLLKKSSVNFEKHPYFLADALNIRNPGISFDVYGDEGLAFLLVMNKAEKDILHPHAMAETPVKEGYGLLLSFHKTLPSVLMKGQYIVQSSPRTPFHKQRWNHVEILASGRNILCFINGHAFLSYSSRKLFSGGLKMLPVYRVPKIKNLSVYSLKTDPFPLAFDVMDTLFFMLRLVLYLFAAVSISRVFLHPPGTSANHFSLFRGEGLLFFTAALLWLFKEIFQHASRPLSYAPLYILHFISIIFFVAGFVLFHKKLYRASAPFHVKKTPLLLAALLFFEGLCYCVSPYADALRKPFYVFVHDARHFWCFDPQVRLRNDYFNLNKARHRDAHYARRRKTRIALFGSSSAFGQYFHLPSSKVFPSQLETKLRQDGRDAEVFNFAFEGSTTFTGLVFLKGIVPLYKPDILVWNYAGNDMLFMRGNIQRYAFYEKLYKKNTLVLHRFFYATYSFHALLNFKDSTWVSALLYVPRRNAKRVMYMNNLHALHAFCRKHGITLVLLHETSERTLRSGYDAKKKVFHDKNDEWFYDALSGFSKKHRIPYLFTVPELTANRKKNLYVDGIHYSKKGHDLMADILFRFLISNHVIP